MSKKLNQKASSRVSTRTQSQTLQYGMWGSHVMV